MNTQLRSEQKMPRLRLTEAEVIKAKGGSDNSRSSVPVSGNLLSGIMDCLINYIAQKTKNIEAIWLQ